MMQSQFSKKSEIIFLCIVTLFWFAQYVYIPYQTTYLSGIHVATGMIGIIVGAYGISQMLFRLPTGICADIIKKHRYFIMVGTLSSGIASAFRLIFNSGFGFFIGNIISGLSSAMWISLMVFYTSHFDSKNQKYAIARIVMFNNCGMLLGFLASTVLYPIFGMKILCLLSIIAGMIGFALSFSIHDLEVTSTNMSLRSIIKSSLSKRLIIFSLGALVQQGIQLATTMSFTNQILKDLGASDILLGISSIIYMLSAVVFAKFSSSKSCAKKSSKFLICTVFIILSLYCIGVPNIHNVYFVMLIQILPGMGTGILFSYLTSEAMKDVDESVKSTAMGFFQAIYAIGMTVFPMIVSQIANIMNMQMGYCFLAIVSFIASFVIYIYYRRIEIVR